MKKYSSKRSVQLLAHILEAYNIQDIILSPGSRNAPLSIHFGEMDYFNTFSIIDERSAAFVAMGMAMQTKKPTAIVCTSGSASANYYPAITEAFYSNIPLLVFTADRPSDFVDLFDGQTIRQNQLFQQHSYGDFQLLEDKLPNSEDYNFNTIKTAVELCIEKQGPVHINIPLDEPLYDLTSELPIFPSIEPTIRSRSYTMPSYLAAEWNTSERILILIGTRDYSFELETMLSQLVKNHSVVVLSEANSNLKNTKFFKHIDRYIFNFTEEDFRTYAPDLLITIGQNVVSKKVKQFLRKAQPKHHWHIDKHWQPDTYFALSQKIETSPEVFFTQLLQHAYLEPRAYYNLWDTLRNKKDEQHHKILNSLDYSDFSFFKLLSEKVPQGFNIHFSNSSAIRYAQLFDFKENNIYCNRGTSGIDGSTSTAMGYAIKSLAPTLLVSGDISFFYDINGLWNQYIPPFTRIIVMNNGGGDIFKFIPGPMNANENILDEFIATKHAQTVEYLAKHFGFEYYRVEDEIALERVLDQFFEVGVRPRILEVNTMKSHNADILKTYFNALK